MKFIYTLILLLPTVLFSQNTQAELIEVKVDEGILLKGVNHLENQTITFIAEITSVGFGLKKLHTVSKRIPAGGEVDLITLIPRPNRQYSYSVNYKYTTSKTRTVNVTENRTTPESHAVEVVTEKEIASPIVETPIQKDGIVVYSKAGCGRCEYVTNYLKANGIPFTDLNITDDRSANDQMSRVLFASGFKGGTFKTPVITIDGEVFYNIPDIKKFVSDIDK